MPLHTVNKSPFSHTALEDCLQVITDKDGLLLLEDGVYAAMPNTAAADKLHQLKQRGVPIYAIAEDLASRGLTGTLPDIESIDYDKFVLLTTKYTTTCSWY